MLSKSNQTNGRLCMVVYCRMVAAEAVNNDHCLIIYLFLFIFGLSYIPNMYYVYIYGTFSPARSRIHTRYPMCLNGNFHDSPI